MRSIKKKENHYKQMRKEKSKMIKVRKRSKSQKLKTK